MYNMSSCSDGGSLAAIGGRDNSLFLFRALGKILYCRRDTTPEGGEEEEGEGAARGSAEVLPPHLVHHHRPRLLVDPEVYVVCFILYFEVYFFTTLISLTFHIVKT